jgi:FkbM family methyltransferase
MDYVPFRIGSEALWKHFVEPRLWWRTYEFTTRTNFGAKIVGSTNELIQKYILFFGVWEPDLTSFVRGRLRPGDTFVDVGAYFGYYSLLASKLVGKSGRVVAIEASPQNFTLLRQNLECNGVQNVRALNAAASDHEESIQLYSDMHRYTGCTTTMKEWADRYKLRPVCKVHALPLSVLLKPDEIQAARLIKIDVEGGEWQVVSGMAEILPACRHDIEITVEVTPLCLDAHGRTFDDLLSIFTSQGFHPYRLEHDVSALSYVRARTPIRPRRIDGPLLEQTDVVFSRIDAESI